LEKSGYEVCDVADNSIEALEIFQAQMPDITLMDINIRGKEDGVYTALKIQEIRQTPIIFLTALSDKPTVDRAKEANPSAYIIKPFNERELNVAIELALHNFSRVNTEPVVPEAEQEFPESTHYVLKERIFVKINSRFEKILLNDILWIEADGNYSNIVTADQKYVLVSNLSSLHEKMAHPLFLRVHRSFIVNLQRIDSFEENRLFIRDKEIPISKSNRAEFIRRFMVI
jgi:DNA-binding LytR/AlgR family response regulator